MTDFIDSLKVWAAQDALLEALGDEDDLDEVAQGIGFPVNIAPQHVWISGDVPGSLSHELSGGNPSEETFLFTVVVYVQQADEYIAVRDSVKGLASAVVRALASSTFKAVVPSWTVPNYRLEEGTDGTHRQVSLSLTVECRCW
jgi:hypothetical protein